MRSGRVFTQLVEFTSGYPDGAIAWALTRPDGTAITSGTITPAADAISAVITVIGTHNTLAGGTWFDARDLTWSYTVGGVQVTGDVRYSVEAQVPFPVTCNGVRNKLGVSAHELPDQDIPLLDAYVGYDTAADIDSYLVSGTQSEIRIITNALEAIAALSVLPTLQLRLAAREQSETNVYARWAKVDFDAIREQLVGYIAAASAVVSPSTGNGLFFVVGPDIDPITGA